MKHIKYAINLELYNQKLKFRRNKIHYTVVSRYAELKMTTSSG